MHEPLSARAAGRWPAILPQLGIAPSYLTGKHTACPICQDGKDRFRFDDKDGRGTFICSVCGAGDGIKLVMAVGQIEFREAARRIEEVIGSGCALATARKAGRTDDEKRAAMNRLWASSRPVQAGDPVALWLGARVGLTAFPPCLRTAQRARYQDDIPTWHPAMIAMLSDPQGRPAILHRTYLNGMGEKAAIEKPRRIMEGTIPKGSAVRLFPHEDVLGIAEGIETALAAASIFGVPCWAATNTTILSHWIPPEAVREVIIFGDNDPKFGGQAAAHALAHRLAVRGRTVRVEIPDRAGFDWNDVLLERASEARRRTRLIECSAGLQEPEPQKRRR
ncbi:toprim domain-containing protein [Enterovirga sp. CN4-39]|uniref:toprim domain-containing protein n=1 Tax=Enterovirga sp. CN4-39 TaxID=3400910 RepID=UPI003BFCEDD1